MSKRKLDKTEIEQKDLEFKKFKENVFNDIDSDELKGFGLGFKKISEMFAMQGINKELSVANIHTNSFRIISEEGIKKLESSLSFHRGKVVSNVTRIYVCKSPVQKGKYIVCDGNHRLEVWRRKRKYLLINLEMQ